MSWKGKLVKAVGDLVGLSGQDLVQAIFGPSTSNARLGTKQLLEAYETMPWLRAVSGRVSTAVASIPWQLYVVREKPTPQLKAEGRRGKIRRHMQLQRSMDPYYRFKQYKAYRAEDSLEEIVDHQALDLLAYGNPKIPGQQVIQTTQQHLDLAGESGWVLDRNGGGLPTAIFPVPPHWIVEMPGAQRASYIITGPQGSLTVPVEDFIFFRHPRPVDPYDRGTGIGMALGDELETDEHAAKHLKAWFKNRARPDILITAEGLSKPEVQKIEESWLSKLGGTMGVNKPHFLNRKVQVDVISQTFQEMQLSDLRKDERDIIIHVYGLPPEVFGILENSNRSTIDAADYLMGKYVVCPRMEFLRIMLQMKLIERFDERLILDYVSPIMEDKEHDLKVMQAAPYAFSIDTWRQQAGQAPLEDGTGKGFMVPFNLEYKESLAESTPEPVIAGESE